MNLHTYTKINYKDAPDHKTTPLNASNLNHMDEGIADAHSDIAVVAGEVETKAGNTDIATVESGTTASRAYSVGELVYVSGTLYRVKTAIASGATFTVGTNVEVTNVSNAIEEVNAKVDRGIVRVTANGVKTLSALLNELYALIDFTKITYKSRFELNAISNTIVRGSISNVNATVMQFSNVSGQYMNTFEVKSSASAFITVDTINNTSTDQAGTVLGAGNTLTIFY